MKRGVSDYENMLRKDWVLNKFGQVVMTVSQIVWSRGCEAAIRSENAKQALQRWYEKQLTQLTEVNKLNTVICCSLLVLSFAFICRVFCPDRRRVLLLFLP